MVETVYRHELDAAFDACMMSDFEASNTSILSEEVCCRSVNDLILDHTCCRCHVCCANCARKHRTGLRPKELSSSQVHGS